MKKIILSIVGIIVILLITALFTPNDFKAKGSVNINKPITTVFTYISSLKNQENFSKWAEMDPNMKRSYQGTDSTVGFIAGWQSEIDNVGVREQEIMHIEANKRIDFELRFIKPYEAQAPAYMTVESILPNETNVQWHFNGTIPFPFNIQLLWNNPGDQISADFEYGLDKLKVILEQN